MSQTAMEIQALQHFLATEFPQSTVTIVSLSDSEVCVRQAIDSRHLRPGATVSGPVLMTVADVAMYVALLNRIGLVALAVTTNLSINFLRKPSADRAIIGICNLIKVGRTQAVGAVTLYSEGKDEAVAHAVCTYAIPSSESKRKD